MKRIALFAVACVVALLLAPISSASAAKLTGACVIGGKAAFFTKNAKGEKVNAVLSETPQALEYEFNGAAKCVEAGTEAKKEGPASVTGGEGIFSCIAKGTNLKDGSGSLFGTYKFDLDVEAGGGSVALLIEESATENVTATGLANFFASKEEEAKKCREGGVHELEFNAVSAGTIGS
jgi:hypothetical protein